MEGYIEGASVENERKNQNGDAGPQLQYCVSLSAEFVLVWLGQRAIDDNIISTKKMINSLKC
ncbi:MAG TPA: hypothetical protein VKZ94_01695, partial [Advenella sp.]|nr:hypothetical protein [Advenella sp.]